MIANELDCLIDLVMCSRVCKAWNKIFYITKEKAFRYSPHTAKIAEMPFCYIARSKEIWERAALGTPSGELPRTLSPEHLDLFISKTGSPTSLKVLRIRCEYLEFDPIILNKFVNLVEFELNLADSLYIRPGTSSWKLEETVDFNFPLLEQATFVRTELLAINLKADRLWSLSDHQIGYIRPSRREFLVRISQPSKLLKLTTNRPVWSVGGYTNLQTLCITEVELVKNFARRIPVHLKKLKTVYFDEIEEWSNEHNRMRLIRSLWRDAKRIKNKLPDVVIKRRSGKFLGEEFDLLKTNTKRTSKFITIVNDNT